MGCHFLLQCMKVKNESEVAQSCLTLSNPMDCSLPGSSIHGIFQARVLEWGAIAFSGFFTYEMGKNLLPYRLLDYIKQCTMLSIHLMLGVKILIFINFDYRKYYIFLSILPFIITKLKNNENQLQVSIFFHVSPAHSKAVPF